MGLWLVLFSGKTGSFIFKSLKSNTMDYSQFVDYNNVAHINLYLADPASRMTGYIEIADKALSIGEVANLMMEDTEVSVDVFNDMLRDQQLVVNMGPIYSIPNDEYVDCIGLEPYYLIKRRK
jgi:hypothetical protein